MVFYDFENFKQSLAKRDNHRYYDYSRVQNLIKDILKRQIPIKDIEDSFLVRAYVYTGEYTPEIMKRIKNDLQEAKQKKDEEEIKRKKALLEKTRKRAAGQKRFIKESSEYHFFELRTYPLKYRGGQIFQKGVDVQLAVDLVTHAFRNNFDIAVVCSGDIDLLESLKIVKSLGKIVVVMSHPKHTARGIRKEADFYIDMSKLNNEELGMIASEEKGGDRE